MTETRMICKLCGEFIGVNERWEYEKGAYPVGTPEADKRRVHGKCVSVLLHEVIGLMARVPEEAYGELDELR